MKTPIQEAIDFINELNDKDTSEFNYYHSAIIEKLNELLEKIDMKTQYWKGYREGQYSGDQTASESFNKTYKNE